MCLHPGAKPPLFPSLDLPLALLAFSEHLGGVSRPSASPRPADMVVTGEKKSDVVRAIRLPVFNCLCSWECREASLSVAGPFRATIGADLGVEVRPPDCHRSEFGPPYLAAQVAVLLDIYMHVFVDEWYLISSI